MKKIINFSDEVLAKIKVYQDSFTNNLNFSEAVRQLVVIGVDSITDAKQVWEAESDESNDDTEGIFKQLNELAERVDSIEKNYSFFQADETQSKLGNLELEVKDSVKKINLLTKVSKLFKSHISNRDIHLQD